LPLRLSVIAVPAQTGNEGDNVDTPGVGGDVQGRAGVKVMEPVKYRGDVFNAVPLPDKPTFCPAICAHPFFRLTPLALNVFKSGERPGQVVAVPLYRTLPGPWFSNANRYCVDAGIKKLSDIKLSCAIPLAVTVVGDEVATSDHAPPSQLVVVPDNSVAV